MTIEVKYLFYLFHLIKFSVIELHALYSMLQISSFGSLFDCTVEIILSQWEDLKLEGFRLYMGETCNTSLLVGSQSSIYGLRMSLSLSPLCIQMLSYPSEPCSQ